MPEQMEASISLSDTEKREVLTFTANGALISAGHYILNFSGFMSQLREGVTGLFSEPLGSMSEAAKRDLEGTLEFFFKREHLEIYEQLNGVHNALYEQIDSAPDDMLGAFKQASLAQARGLIRQAPPGLPALHEKLPIEDVLQLIALQSTLGETEEPLADYFGQIDSLVHSVTPAF